MSQNSTNEFRVGLFTLIGLGAIGYIFFVLNPESFRSNRRHTYYTILNDAAGIVIKTHVKTNGVIIGKVLDIQLQVSDTRIDIEIDGQVKIPQGSQIAIKEKGLLGDVFLEIYRHPDQGTYLTPGDFIPPDTNQVTLSSLIAVGGSIAQDIKKITGALAQVVGGEDGTQAVVGIFSDIRSITSDLKEILKDNKGDVRSLVSQMEKTTTILHAFVRDKDRDLRSLVDHLRSFSQAAQGVLNPENQTKIHRIIASLDRTMGQIESASQDVKAVTAKVERGEGTIGRLLSEDGVLAEFEDTLKEVKALLKPATKMQTDVDYHGELRQDKTTQHYFNLALKMREDKSYLLGFSDVGESVKEVTSETRTESGQTTYVKDHVTERKAIRFHVQFAKRWHFVQMRFGLFETTGGVASDVYAFQDRVKFSLEAFDWNSQSSVRRTAHFKAYSSLLLWNHIYAMMGLDDWTRLSNSKGTGLSTKPNWFLGGGLTFNDQDLKSLVGMGSLAL